MSENILSQDMADLSDIQIDRLISILYGERHRRAMRDNDLSALAQDAIVKGFTSVGDPLIPQIIGDGGLLAVTNIVKDTSKVKHKCHLYTVRPHMGSTEEWWVWDESCPSYLYSDMYKEGAIRRSVAIHTLHEGMVLIQHSMTHDGMRHERKGSTGFKVHVELDDNGEEVVQLVRDRKVVSTSLPQHLQDDV